MEGEKGRIRGKENLREKMEKKSETEVVNVGNKESLVLEKEKLFQSGFFFGF